MSKVYEVGNHHRAEQEVLDSKIMPNKDEKNDTLPNKST